MNSNVSEHEYLSGLRREVEQNIDTYVYRVPEGALGNPTTAKGYCCFTTRSKDCSYWHSAGIKG